MFSKLSESLPQLYKFLGIYDIILGIPLLFFPVIVFDLFKLDEYQPYSPFTLVTGSGLIVIGYLLIYYSKDAKNNLPVGYATIFVRLSFSISILINTILFSLTYHVLFVIFAVTDGITGLLLLIAIFALDDE